VATPTSCAAIGGATGATYVVTVADAGTVLRVTETATNLNGRSLPATSAATAAVPAVPAAPTPVVVTPSFTG
jgi:hypothetical protein